MATATCTWKTVVWERSNKIGKWCPYTAEVSQLLEQSYRKNLPTVWLGDVDICLKIYSVNLKELVQVSEVTGTKSLVRRNLCETTSGVAKGYIWQWHGDGHDAWHPYEVDVINYIENCYQEGSKHIDLSEQFSGYNYEINFTKLHQRNKRTKYKRPIRRELTSTPYPLIKCPTEQTAVDVPKCDEMTDDRSSHTDSDIEEIPGTQTLVKQMSSFLRRLRKSTSSDNPSGSSTSSLRKSKKTKCENIGSDSESKTALIESKMSLPPQSSNTTALVNGKPWDRSWPPDTPQSKIKPVPGIEPLSKVRKSEKNSKTKATENNVPDLNVFEEYTEVTSVDSSRTAEDRTCSICWEDLTASSSYSEDNIVVKLKLCPHVFHRACLEAMYNNGPKERYLQCPICKTIHGEKCGIQPPGEMQYHVLPYSLPGFASCDTIRIIYDIKAGTQGPEHPHPGRHYSARGFPRHCYLPDNEIGRKVLRLFIKAWQRHLMFTIGQSATTGEDNTVTWNEIHHKTEFGCNRHGHGYPDPNYFENVLAELAAHGVTDDTFAWYPA